jgi:hypothetical protein
MKVSSGDESWKLDSGENPWKVNLGRGIWDEISSISSKRRNRYECGKH